MNMKVIVISNTCSNDEFQYIQSIKHTEKLSPQQNYFSMLIDGLSKDPEIEKIVCISARLIAQSNCSVKELPAKKETISEKITFIYPKVLARNGLRNINNIVRIIQSVNHYLKENRLCGDVIFSIIDPLAFDITTGALIALRKITTIGIITDIPIYVGQIEKDSKAFSRIKTAIKQRIFMSNIRRLSGFCFLTSAMNEINNKKPYCIVEGMVPDNISLVHEPHSDGKKIILYAGGLYEKFGINNLVDAACEIEDIDFELHLYGEGTSVDYINHIHELHHNIIYKGILSVDEIKAVEQKATILVNTRPCDEGYTKYSFPSKTLEYMSSGRPVLTTKLKGIPDEYYEYVYSIEDNTVASIKKSLIDILNTPEDELKKKGQAAFDFVCNHKNAKKQSEKIIQLVKKINNGLQ